MGGLGAAAVIFEADAENGGTDGGSGGDDSDEAGGESGNEDCDSLDGITALLGKGFLRTGDELDVTIDRAEISMLP